MNDNVALRDQEVLKLMYDLGKGPYRSLPSYTHIREFTETFPKPLEPKFVADGLPPPHDQRKNTRIDRKITRF